MRCLEYTCTLPDSECPLAPNSVFSHSISHLRSLLEPMAWCRLVRRVEGEEEEEEEEEEEDEEERRRMRRRRRRRRRRKNRRRRRRRRRKELGEREGRGGE